MSESTPTVGSCASGVRYTASVPSGTPRNTSAAELVTGTNSIDAPKDCPIALARWRTPGSAESSPG